MNSWLNLIKKEYRMSRKSILAILVMMLIVGLWLMYSNRQHMGIIFAPASLLVFFALVYPAIFMFSSVSKELKNTSHLWLHCPQPAWMLLTAKLLMAVIYMLLFLLLAASGVYIGLFLGQWPHGASMTTEQMALIITELGLYASLAITVAALYLASWSTLIVVVSATVRNWLGRFHRLASLAVFLVATWGMGWVYNSWLFTRVTQWGSFEIKPLSLRYLSLASQDFGGPVIYTGQIVAIILAIVAIFALATWLIDNKVEV